MQFDELKELVRSGLMVRSHSGKVEPGEVFVAVPGAKVDGAQFIPQAIENGAAYIVAESALKMPRDTGATLIIHPDPGEALGLLAAAYFGTEHADIPVIGITGTNGKTTVSYMLEHLLTKNGRTVGVIGTVNYRWPGFMLEAPLTTPDSWQIHELLSNMVAGGVDVVVMEVSSHALDQSRVGGVNFQAAVLTNVTQDHLDYHGDMDTYFRAKSKLFQRIEKSPQVCVVNWDDPYGRVLINNHTLAMGYGLYGEADGGLGVDGLMGEIRKITRQGITLAMHYQGEEFEITSPMVGKYNASNLLATAAVGLAMGLRPRHLKCMETFAGVPGRLERILNDKGLDVFVDYAHTPDALENVLKTLSELDFKRVLTVFGCGGDRDRAKRPLMGQAACNFSDIAVLTSDNPRTEDPERIMDDVMPGVTGCAEVIREGDRRKAIRLALARMEPGDVLLIAGKGHENYQILGTEKIPFSDQDEVAEALL